MNGQYTPGAGLFGAATGPAQQAPGKSQFERSVYQGTENQMAPRYEQAAMDMEKQISNTFAKGKEMDLGAAGQAMLKESYIDRLNDAASQASTRGAILAAEDRERERTRAFQRENRKIRFDMARKQQERGEEMARTAAFNQFISSGAESAGEMAGGYISDRMEKYKRDEGATAAALSHHSTAFGDNGYSQGAPASSPTTGLPGGFE